MKTISKRLEELERSGTGTGAIYFVMVADGVFTVTDSGQEYNFTEEEFGKWENTKSENDMIFVVTRRDAAKDGSDV